jgi:cysteine-rich repeat protein
MHCIFNACVKNACGDGYKAGHEECDDGNQVEGDGCSARCTNEACGNSVVESGEACDDGENNGEPDAGCTAHCRLADRPAVARDAGSADAGNGPSCPTSGGLMTSATLALEPVTLSGPAFMGASYLWYVGENGKGELGQAQAATSSFVCKGDPGPRTLFRITTKDGCLPVQGQLVLQCDADAGVDAGQGELDAGQDAGGNVDAGSGMDSGPTDSGAQLDSGPAVDAQRPSDAGVQEAGSSVSAACMNCMTTMCNELPDLGLGNVAAVCFQNDPNGVNGSFAQPKTSQACTAAVSCAINAADGCLRGSSQFSTAVGDPSLCYCGQQDPTTTCAANGPLSNAPCTHEFEVATECDSMNDAVARNQCVSGLIADFGKPAGYAWLVLGCAATTCASQCGVAP